MSSTAGVGFGALLQTDLVGQVSRLKVAEIAQATVDAERASRIAGIGKRRGGSAVVHLAVIGNQLCSTNHLLPSTASYTEYFIEVRTMASKHQVVKRYSEFVGLDSRLRADYPEVEFEVSSPLYHFTTYSTLST